MEWMVLAAPAALLTCYVLLPGMVIAVALGLRGILALTFAPLLSLAVLAGAAGLTSVTALTWGPVPVLAATAAGAFVAWLFTRRSAASATNAGFATEAAPPAPPASVMAHANEWFSAISLAGYAAFLGGVALFARHLTNLMPGPTSISQTFDNVFHLNTIRFLTETGASGPVLPSGLNMNAAESIFYPTAWHSLAVLAMPAAGTVPVASNATLLVVIAVVWPLSALALVLTVLRPAASVAAAEPASSSVPAALRPGGPVPVSSGTAQTSGVVLTTAVLAAAMPAFPFLMLDWGVLYPNMLGYALVPAVLAAGAAALRVPVAGHLLGRVPAAVIVGFGLLGVTLAHPNALLLALCLLAPLGIAGGWNEYRQWRAGAETTRAALTVALLLTGAAAVFVFLWWWARPSNIPWGPLHSEATALGEVLLNNPIGRPPAVFVSVLMVAGILRIIRTGVRRWLLASFGIAAGLWLVASAFQPGWLREFLTSAWYSDSYRFGAALPLLALPLAALGAEWLLGSMVGTRAVRNRAVGTRAVGNRAVGNRAMGNRVVGTRGMGNRAVSAALVVVLPLSAVVATQWSPSMRGALSAAWASYDYAVEPCVPGDNSCLLTEDEAAILFALPNTTPEDAVILADPHFGGALAYAFTGRQVLLSYIGQRPDPATEVLLEHLNDPTNPAVCPAVAETGVTHVLDFGTQTVHSRPLVHPGLTNLEDSPMVALVDAAGAARLYEVVGCG